MNAGPLSPNCLPVVAASLIVALILTIVPLPEAVDPFRPEWATLVLIYWCLALPTRVGLGTAWMVGIMLDVLKGTLLGQHALGMTMVAFIVLKLHLRIRVHPLWQQAISVGLLLALNQLLVLWIHGMMGRPITDWLHWAPTASGALLWPLVFVALRRLRRRFHLS
ncbi:rod shape-determining protein MreD [Endothiovibrio diazotrophicus]